MVSRFRRRQCRGRGLLLHSPRVAQRASPPTSRYTSWLMFALILATAGRLSARRTALGQCRKRFILLRRIVHCGDPMINGEESEMNRDPNPRWSWKLICRCRSESVACFTFTASTHKHTRAPGFRDIFYKRLSQLYFRTSARRRHVIINWHFRAVSLAVVSYYNKCFTPLHPYETQTWNPARHIYYLNETWLSVCLELDFCRLDRYSSFSCVDTSVSLCCCGMLHAPGHRDI